MIAGDRGVLRGSLASDGETVGGDTGSATVGAQSLCPKLCGGRLRLVESSRWGRHRRCGRCGHECRVGRLYDDLDLHEEAPET